MSTQDIWNSLDRTLKDMNTPHHNVYYGGYSTQLYNYNFDLRSMPGAIDFDIFKAKPIQNPLSTFQGFDLWKR